MYTKTASGGSISVPGPGDPSVSARSAIAGHPLSAGTTRNYFVYYRAPIVLGACAPTSTFNTSQALARDVGAVPEPASPERAAQPASRGTPGPRRADEKTIAPR